MGIVNLNRFLIDNVRKSAIHKQKLSQMKNRTISIDTSIYLYKYVSQNALCENFYTMISLFRQNNITPIFVFDGKPPPEKQDVLEERKQEKSRAEEQYKLMEAQWESKQETMTVEEQKEYKEEMEALKSQCIRIKNRDIAQVKKLMKLYGVTYYEADGEADQVCAGLVISGKAWACMSDDMDMFAYGCPRVLRHFSIIHKNVLYYDLSKICTDLRMDVEVFRKIAILSGTDYNIHSNTSLRETMKWYETFVLDNRNQLDFYTWLCKNTKYIENYEQLQKTVSMFDITHELDKKMEEIQNIELRDYDKEQLHEFLKEDGFVIPK